MNEIWVIVEMGYYGIEHVWGPFKDMDEAFLNATHWNHSNPGGHIFTPKKVERT